MLSGNQEKIIRALYGALRPLARALLRSGVGYREFSEISKAAFVDVASTDYGLRGRPTNISRVAVMTGLTRKEVKRLRDKIEAGRTYSIEKAVPAGYVLGEWFNNPSYLDRSGSPKILEFDSGECSFAALVKRAGGDIPPGAMRTELIRINAVEELEDGRLRALRSVFTPANLDDRLAVAFEYSLKRLGETIFFNTDPKNRDNERVERTVMTKAIRSSDLARVRRTAKSRLEEFGVAMNDLFSAYEALFDDTESKDARSVGVGFYYFEDSPKD